MPKREIHYIPEDIMPIITNIIKPKRVAAYCRVSHEQDDQYGSLEHQISYYTSLINNNPNWINKGIFSEQGSGKTIKNRNEFKKLIAKCKRGSIDIIITKFISRFARNSLDLIKTCRELKALNVDVWFENEGIKLLDTESMLTLETYAAIAQEENRSKSEDIKWGVRKGFALGMSGYINFTCYGYINGEKGLEIDKTQAKIVRSIFSWRAEGKSLGYISKELQKRNIPSPNGKEIWSRETINKLLKNEKVCGNVLLQKTL